MDPKSAIRTATGLARAVARWERPDRLPSNLIVAGLVGPTLAGAVAGATVRDPERLAIVDDDRYVSYGALWHASQSLARRLAAGGVTSRSVVGLLSGNSSAFVVGMVAISILGADTVFLNTGFAAPQLDDVCEAEGVTQIVCDSNGASMVESIARVGFVVESPTAGSPAAGSPAAGSPAAGSVPGRAELGVLADRWRALVSPSSIIPSRRNARQVILTSGTTGRPKGANRSGVQTSGLGIFAVVPIRSGDRVVIACPLFHAWGLSNLVIALALGSCVRLPSAATPPNVSFYLGSLPGDDAPADGLVVVPAVLQRLLAGADHGQRYPTLRYVVSSGSRIPPPVVEGALQRFGPTLYNFYGSTEVSLATIASPADLGRYPATAGRVVPGTAVSILDEDGDPVPAGETGHIYVDATNAFDGYTGGGDKRRQRGLVETGDLGHFEDGLLFIDGRSDDMIVSGGENVYPGEVEDLIGGLDGVIEAAVVGVEDDDFGQRLVAVVVAEDHVGAAEVQAAVRSSLARFKVPRDVYFVAELPRTESGKVRRQAINALIDDATVLEKAR